MFRRGQRCRRRRGPRGCIREHFSEAAQSDPHFGARGAAARRRRQGHLDLEWREFGGLGRLGRGRHIFRRQRRQLQRNRRADPAGLLRPHPARAPRGAGRLLDRGRHPAGAHRARALERPRPHSHECPMGDGRRRAGAARRARRRARPDPRRHLRRRHAVQDRRNFGAVRNLLLPDRLVGAGISRAVEARLSQVPGLAWRCRLRGPVACRRP